MIIPQPRPFEFRAYHVPTNTLFDVAFFTAEKVFETRWLIYFPRAECVLMQFTGLYDCQGTKVFEGDVLYWYNPASGIDPSREYWHVVIYRCGCFFECYGVDQQTPDWLIEPMLNTEQDRVVGCHWLQPELLELNANGGDVPASFD